MISTLFPRSIAATKWLAVGIVGLGLMYLGHYVGEAFEPGRAPTPPDTVRVEREAYEGDLPEATIPDFRTQYEPPGTTDTYRSCFQVPKWFSQSTASGEPSATTTKTATAPSASVDTAARWPSTTTSTVAIFSRKSAGPGYGIIPMTNGRPTVSVGSDLVQVPVFDRRATLTTYEYDIPQDRWALWPAVEVSTTPVGLQATGAVSLRYRKVTLSVGYTTLAGERGVTAGLALRPFTLTW